MTFSKSDLLKEMEDMLEEDIFATYDIVKDFNYFQRSCLEGRSEEVRDTLSLGLVDLNKADRGPLFLPLVLATYSASAETVFEILDGGVNGGIAIRSALRLAAHKGFQHISDVIKNFISRSSLKVYTDRFDMSSPLTLSNLHRFICETNIHPVRIAINVLKYQLNSQLENVFKILNMMYKDEMEKGRANGPRGLKYFYMAVVVSEIGRFEKYCLQYFGNVNCSTTPCEVAIFYFITCFHKYHGKDSIMMKLFRHCLRDFKYHDSEIHKTLLRNVSNNTHNNERIILRDTILGPRTAQFVSRECSCCGNLFAKMQCPDCNDVYFCGDPCELYYSKVHEIECKKDFLVFPNGRNISSLHNKVPIRKPNETIAESDGTDGDSIELYASNESLKSNHKNGSGASVGSAASVGSGGSRRSSEVSGSQKHSTSETPSTEEVMNPFGKLEDQKIVAWIKRGYFHSPEKSNLLDIKRNKTS